MSDRFTQVGIKVVALSVDDEATTKELIKGFPAWLMPRGYHVLAVPTWERKIRVLSVWLTAALFGRDLVSLLSMQHPRKAFVNGGEPDRSDASQTPSLRAGRR